MPYIRHVLIGVLVLSCSPLHADGWSVSGSIAAREARSTLPGAESTEKGWSATATATRPVEKWTLGGGLSYSLGTIDAAGNADRYRPAATTAVALASRDIGGGRAILASLGYGNSAIDSARVGGGATVSYTAKSDFLSSSLGLTQAVNLSRRSLAILSARYTHIGSRAHAYTDSAGIQTPGADSAFGFYSLGAGYSQRFGRTTAYVQTDWNTARKEFVSGTGDRDYVSISAGLDYRLDAKTHLGVSFSTVAGKAYSRDNSIGISVRYAF